MKASFALAAIGASFVAAQSLDQLPQCGQTCIQNMINIASGDLGCAAGNVTCYCTEPDFGYGVRDCANEACESDSDASTVISFGTSYCANAIQSYASSASGQTTPTNSAGSILAGATGGAGSAASDASGSASSTASDASSAISTSALIGVITTDGSTLTTTTGSTTLYGGAVGTATSGAGSLTSGAGSAASSATDGAGSAASSATDGAGSAASSATGGAGSAASSATDGGASAASSAESGASSATEEAGSAATGESSAESGNFAPVQTAAPMFIGAVALAVLAL